MRSSLVLVLGLVAACSNKAPVTAPAAAHAASAPSAAWGLPPAEADLASRRVRGSTVAHVDESVAAPKADFKKVAGPFTGRAGERDLPTPSSFAIEKGSCYRAYVTADPAIHALAVVIEDAKGGTVVDDATDVAPARGAFCADESAQLTVKLAAGLGQGSYSVELWAVVAPHK